MSGEQAMNKEEINCQHLNFFLALYCLPQWFSCEKDPSFHGENSFPDGSVVKNLPAVQEMWVWSLGGEDPWRREWQPTPVFLPGDSHRWKNVVGYGPWGYKRVGHNLETRQQQMVGWCHPLKGHEFEQTPRDGEGQGTWRAAVHGGTESDTT